MTPDNNPGGMMSDRAAWLVDLLHYAIQFHIDADVKREDVVKVADSLSDSDEYDDNVGALVQMPKWCSPSEAQDAVDKALALLPSPQSAAIPAGMENRYREALEQCELAAKHQMDECHRAAHSELIDPELKRGWAAGSANSGVIYRKIRDIRSALAYTPKASPPADMVMDDGFAWSNEAMGQMASALDREGKPNAAVCIRAAGKELIRLRALLRHAAAPQSPPARSDEDNTDAG